jgi:SAM-dependent methyltransferase
MFQMSNLIHQHQRDKIEQRLVRRQSVTTFTGGIVLSLLLFCICGCSVFTSSADVIPTGFWEAFESDVQNDDGQVLGKTQHGFRFLTSVIAEDEEGNLKWQWSCTFTNTGSSTFGGALNYVLYDRDGNDVTSDAAYTGRLLPGASMTVGGLSTVKRSDAARVSEGGWQFVSDDNQMSLRSSVFVEAATQAGGAVLELGCGTGRILIPTARAGVEIVGIDLSQHMLDECRQRLLRESEKVQRRVRLEHADMRGFRLPQTFRLVTVPFRAFQHLETVEDQLSCLASIRKHLDQDGRLILDLFNPLLEALVRDNLGEELEEKPGFTTPDGRQVVRMHKTVTRDRFTQVFQAELIYYVTHPDGRKERLVQAFPMRYLHRFEAEHLLVRGGFAIENLYADFDKNPFGSKYPGDLIFVARQAVR